MFGSPGGNGNIRLTWLSGYKNMIMYLVLENEVFGLLELSPY